MAHNENGSLHGEFVLKESKPEKSEQLNNGSREQPKGKIDITTPRTKAHFYSSLCYYPEGVTFQNQEEDEEVILLIRRDFITNVPWIISVILLAILPPILFVAAPFFFPALSVSALLVILSFTFYYLVLFGFVLMYFAIWYFNVGIVTNKRVIDLDVSNILTRENSEVRFTSIADVSYTQVGSIRSFFDYGDVFIIVQAAQQNIEFDRAPNPNMIRKVIGGLIVDVSS